MSDTDWIPIITKKLKEISEIEAVRDYRDTPGTIEEYPMVIVATENGTIAYSPGGPKIEHTRVNITLYLSSAIIPEGLKLAHQIKRKIRDKLAANMKLDNTVDEFGPVEEDIWFEGPGKMQDYAGKIHLGISFHYRVKENVTAEFEASQ